ncbi:MAG: ankyrin repeat domain-containing protein [Solirubrobacteraceae bacterium]
MHWAASSDDVEVLDALLDAGADIEAPGAILGGVAQHACAVAQHAPSGEGLRTVGPKRPKAGSGAGADVGRPRRRRVCRRAAPRLSVRSGHARRPADAAHRARRRGRGRRPCADSGRT